MMVALDAKDWQLLALGALVSLALSVVVAALPDLRALALRVAGKAPTEKALLRTWHTYHFTRDQEGLPMFRYEQWELSRRLFGLGRIIVHTIDPVHQGLKYHGTVRHEHGTAVIFFKAPHIETFYVRTRNPVHFRTHELLFGLVSGIDFQSNAFQTSILMSSNLMTLEEAKNHLWSKTVYSEPEFRMSIKRNGD